MSEHVHGPECAHEHGHGIPVRLGTVGGKEPCPCGSGKKYKHCCYQKLAAAASELASKAREASAASTRNGPEGQDSAEAATAEGRLIGSRRAPVIARGPVMAPRNPPNGSAAKARRSGHRKV